MICKILMNAWREINAKTSLKLIDFARLIHELESFAKYIKLYHTREMIKPQLTRCIPEFNKEFSSSNEFETCV